MTAAFDVDGLLADRCRRVIVCCGSGGVGKTTTAASMAVRAADAGRKVVVLTIDPARRLAQALGLNELDNAARRVDGVGSADGGLLDAAMLDMKTTFDDLILTHARPDKARQILANPIYQSLSSSFAGTQEYMAMERLGQLLAEAERTGSHDLIVVDTPPSRSALDFLDAPERLAGFLDGRFVRLLAAPTRGPLRLLSAGLGMATSMMTKIVGSQLLSDMSSLAAALDTVFGGFRERAERTYRLLGRPSTAFVVVATPDADTLREASYFAGRLSEQRMPLVGLVLNRVVRPVSGLSLDRARVARDRLLAGPSSPTAELAAELLALHAESATAAAVGTRLADRFAAAHPGLPSVQVPGLPTDVHDIKALREVGRYLATRG